MPDNDIEPPAAWLPVLTYIQAHIAATNALRDHLVAQCEAPGGLKRIRESSAVLEYFCKARRGCLLLLVWRTRDGLMFYQPGYKLAPDFNTEHSTADGRAANTVDGDRRWKPQAGALHGFYRDLPDGGGLQLQCGHVSRLVSGNELLDQAQAATPGQPRRRFL